MHLSSSSNPQQTNASAAEKSLVSKEVLDRSHTCLASTIAGREMHALRSLLEVENADWKDDEAWLIEQCKAGRPGCQTSAKDASLQDLVPNLNCDPCQKLQKVHI